MRVSAHPTIVCLCGSGRFKESFQQAEHQETLAGKIVLTIGVNCHDHVARSKDLNLKVCKPMLDELHLRKIDIANELLVLNVGGYIGESTANEIKYAQGKNIPIRFWEPVHSEQDLGPNAVPPVCWIRSERYCAMLVVAVKSDSVEVSRPIQCWLTFSELRRDGWEYSADRKDWKPCAMEGAWK